MGGGGRGRGSLASRPASTTTKARSHVESRVTSEKNNKRGGRKNRRSTRTYFLGGLPRGESVSDKGTAVNVIKGNMTKGEEGKNGGSPRRPAPEDLEGGKRLREGGTKKNNTTLA